MFYEEKSFVGLTPDQIPKDTLIEHIILISINDTLKRTKRDFTVHSITMNDSK